MKEKVAIAGLVALLAVLVTIAPISANMANPYQEGDQVGEPTGDLRSVAIEHESIVLNLVPLAQDAPAHVIATYDVRNDGPAKNLALLFVATALANDQNSGGVWLDDQPVPSQVAPAKLPPSWQPPKTTPGIGSGPDLPYYAGNGTQRGITFILALPAGRHRIRVEYDARASAVATQTSPVRYWQLGYVLSPARDWKSFGQLDVQVNVPPAWALVSTVPLRRSGDAFKGTFDGIPADTIAITAQAPVPPQPFSFDFTPFAFLIACGLATGAGIGAGRLLRVRGRSAGWAIPIAAVVAIALAAFVAASSQIANPTVAGEPLQRSWIYGYGAGPGRDFEAVILGLLTLPVGFALTQLAAYWTRRRGKSSRLTSSN